MAQTEQSVGHTKGPWRVVPYGDGDSLVICSDEGGEWRICFMATHGGTASVWRAIQANARLIAAAPELLSIVKRFVALPGGAWHPERHAADEAELMTDARAAIAKACGGSQ